MIDSVSKQENKLRALRKSIPFLRLIPDYIYFNLDSDEFYIPTGHVSNLRSELEEKLNHYVMAYKRDVFLKNVEGRRHLCANLMGARLSVGQRCLLEKYEEKVVNFGVSFVVYQKPLMFTNPETSSVSRLSTPSIA